MNNRNEVSPQTVKIAEDIRDRLIDKLGGGWTIVYESGAMGSKYWYIKLGTIRIHYNVIGKFYTVHISDENTSGTPIYYGGWGAFHHPIEPADAVRHAVDFAKAKIQKTLDVFNSNIGLMDKF